MESKFKLKRYIYWKKIRTLNLFNGQTHDSFLRNYQQYPEPNNTYKYILIYKYMLFGQIVLQIKETDLCDRSLYTTIKTIKTNLLMITIGKLLHSSVLKVSIFSVHVKLLLF